MPPSAGTLLYRFSAAPRDWICMIQNAQSVAAIHATIRFTGSQPPQMAVPDTVCT